MEISYRNQGLAKLFDSERELRRAYGDRQARIILARIGLLANVETLAMVPHSPPERMHQLAGARQNQFAVNLVHPYRLVFCPGNDPVPLKEDGGIDLTRVTAITILEVVDYHQ